MIFGRELFVGLVIGFVAAWLWHSQGVKRYGVPAFPIISYDRKNGVALDWMGRAFNWTNPGR